MTTTTTIPGPSGDKELNGWYAYINGGDYPDTLQKELAETLLHEEMNEFNALLPENWTWFPSTSEIILPFDHEDTEEMDHNELLRQASAAVIARFAEIEVKALESVKIRKQQP
jgi:hypothetical protein